MRFNQENQASQDFQIFSANYDNMFYVDDHINCSISEDDFVKKNNLNCEILCDGRFAKIEK